MVLRIGGRSRRGVSAFSGEWISFLSNIATGFAHTLSRRISGDPPSIAYQSVDNETGLGGGDHQILIGRVVAKLWSKEGSVSNYVEQMWTNRPCHFMVTAGNTKLASHCHDQIQRLRGHMLKGSERE